MQSSRRETRANTKIHVLRNFFRKYKYLSDADSRALLERLKGKTAFLRDACYLPHEGRRDVNTFSEQLNANYACRYRTLTEYISLCTDSGWKLKDIRRAFPDEIESAYGTKQWSLHLEK